MNFEGLNNFLDFSNGSYYKFFIVIRNKDKNETSLPIESKEILIKEWLVSSFEELQKFKPEMVALADAVNGRVYMTINRKSYIKTLLQMQQKLHDYVKEWTNNPEVSSVQTIQKIPRNATSCKETSAKGTKYILIDWDNTEIDKISVFCQYLSSIIGDLYVFPTKNGFHIVGKRCVDIRSIKLPDFAHIETNGFLLVHWKE